MRRKEEVFMNSDCGNIIRQTVKKNVLLAVGIFIAVCGAVVISLLPPLVLAKMIDAMTQKQNVGFTFVALYFGLTALTGVMEASREGFLTVFGQKITHALRSSLMEKFTRLTAVIWFQNKGLALVLFILLPFLFWFTRYVQKNMLAAQVENRRAVSRASGHVPETLHNIRTIHNLSKENYMEKRYDEYIQQSYHAMEKTNFYDAVYSPVILILNAVVVALVMLLSASGSPKVLTLFGMSAGTAVAVMNYISQIFTPLESLGMEIKTIQSAMAGVQRINEFFALPEPAPKQHENTADSKPVQNNGKSFVEFRDVTFGYDEHTVLRHLSFQVEEGEQITLSGRTGAGKSTVFKLLLGLYEPGEGSVWIDGREAAAIDWKDRRFLFGYVEQSFHRVAGTVKDQITLYDEKISMENVKEAAELTGLHDTIMHLPDGYDTICTPELFSQGQWQLLSIARAAAARPKLLLLDEITANLDAETEKEVLEALKRVSENRTVISISHRVSAKMGRIIPIEQKL